MKRRRARQKGSSNPLLAYRLKRPLTWWRHVVIEKIADEDLTRFQRALEAGSVGKLESDLIRHALHDGDLALHAALQLLPFTAPEPDDRVDLAISWAVMAVSLGKDLAALLVAEAMRKILERIDAHPWLPPPDAAEIVRMRRRMHSWFQMSSIHSFFVDLREGDAPLSQAVGKISPKGNFTLIPAR